MLNEESPRWLDLTAAVFGTLVTALVGVVLIAAVSFSDWAFAAISFVLLVMSGGMTVVFWRSTHGPSRSLGGRLTLASLLMAIAGALLPDPDGGITLRPHLTGTQFGFFAVSVVLALASVGYGIRAEEQVSTTGASPQNGGNGTET